MDIQNPDEFIYYYSPKKIQQNLWHVKNIFSVKKTSTPLPFFNEWIDTREANVFLRKIVSNKLLLWTFFCVESRLLPLTFNHSFVVKTSHIKHWNKKRGDTAKRHNCFSVRNVYPVNPVCVFSVINSR